jgi:hypothetical protein
MNVMAFCSPLCPDWRWRIVSYDGETVSESHQTFPTIAAAVADGTRRLVEMNVEHFAELNRARRWTERRRNW